MPKTKSNTTGHISNWTWAEAFMKFGFGDGDGPVETWQVEEVLSEAGYQITTESWSCHNVVIISVKDTHGNELIPYDDTSLKFGYDDPRNYLPPKIVKLLDAKLPD